MADVTVSASGSTASEQGLIDLTPAVIAYRTQLIQQQLRSVAKHGIIPLRDVDTEACQTTFIFGSEETQNNVCANLLDVTGQLTIKDLMALLSEATWEEYTGIFGIATERIWSFAFTDEELKLLLAQEIDSRLHSNIVFVLAPPQKVGMGAFKNTDGAVSPVQQLSCYELRNNAESFSDDGFSMERGACLNTGEKIHSKRLIEIKTTHKFPSEEILFVLVPEKLIPLLPEEFTKEFSSRIIKVPNVKGAELLYKLPEILAKLHGQTHNALKITPPDYQRAIFSLVRQHKRVALHTMRLPTIFDLEARPVADLFSPGMDALIAISQAKVVWRSSCDARAWAIVHKSKLIDPQILQRAKAGLIDGLTISAKFDVREIRQQWIAAKGQNITIRLHDLTTAQISGLTFLTPTAIQINYGDKATGLQNGAIDDAQVIMCTILPAQKLLLDPKKLTQLGTGLVKKQQHAARMADDKQQAETKMQEEIEARARARAATLIQERYRGFRVRKEYLAVKHGKVECTAAYDRLLAAKHRLDKLKEELLKAEADAAQMQKEYQVAETNFGTRLAGLTSNRGSVPIPDSVVLKAVTVTPYRSPPA